jgi:hypothetical protein
MQYYKVEPIQLEGAASFGTPRIAASLGTLRIAASLGTHRIAASECPHFPPALTACFMTSSLRGKIRFIMLLTFPLNGCINPRKWRCQRTMSLLATAVPASRPPSDL